MYFIYIYYMSKFDIWLQFVTLDNFFKVYPSCCMYSVFSF